MEKDNFQNFGLYGELSTCRIKFWGEMIADENIEGNLILKENPLCQKQKRNTFEGEDDGKNINGMLNSSNHKKM